MRNTYLRVPFYIAGLVLFSQAITAKDTCRFVPAFSKGKSEELHCKYDQDSNTLNCEGASLAVAGARIQYVFKYPNKSAFVREAISGQIQHTFRSWRTSYQNIDRLVTLWSEDVFSYEEGRLISIETTTDGDKGPPELLTFTQWDQSGRPVAGRQNKYFCEDRQGNLSEMRDIPVRVIYNQKARKRTTVFDFSKAQPVVPGLACLESTLESEESYNAPFGKAKGNDGQKICIE